MIVVGTSEVIRLAATRICESGLPEKLDSKRDDAEDLRPECTILTGQKLDRPQPGFGSPSWCAKRLASKNQTSLGTFVRFECWCSIVPTNGTSFLRCHLQKDGNGILLPNIGNRQGNSSAVRKTGPLCCKSGGRNVNSGTPMTGSGGVGWVTSSALLD